MKYLLHLYIFFFAMDQIKHIYYNCALGDDDDDCVNKNRIEMIPELD